MNVSQRPAPAPPPPDLVERSGEFTGREWVLDSIDAWLASPRRRLLLTGTAGSGKSTIAARLVEMGRGDVDADGRRHLGPGVPAYAHFCRARDDPTLDPLRFIEALSEHLARRVPPYAQALLAISDAEIEIDASAAAERVEAGGTVAAVIINSLHIGNLSARIAFDRLIRRPLEQALDPGGEPLVIVVDGLDEALTYGEDNLVELLAGATDAATELPPAVRLLLTSRPDERVLGLLELDPLDLTADAPAGADDLFAYARARLKEVANRGAVARRVAEAAEGSFLYARYVVDELLAEPSRMDDPGDLDLPSGLSGHYRDYLKRELARRRERWEDRYRPLLGLLAVARGRGLPRSLLMSAVDLEEDRADDALLVLSQYLSGRGPDGPLRVFHQSFRDFLLESGEYRVYPGLASRRLAETLLEDHAGRWSPAPTGDPAEEYALENVVTHLVEAVEGAKKPDELRGRLVELLTDFAFLDARTARSGIYALMSDFGAALGALPVEHEGRRLLVLLDELLRYDSHFLARHPAALLERCWFRGWWYDAPVAASFFAEPDGGWPPPGPPWEAPGPKLSGLVERWRAEKEERTPGLRWLRSLRPPPDPLASAQVAVLTGHDDELFSVDVSSDGSAVVSCGSDAVRLWDASTGAPLGVRSATEEIWPTDVCFVLRGTAVVAGFSDGVVRLLDARELRELHHTPGGPGVRAVASTPDGGTVVVGDDAGVVRLLDAATLDERGRREGTGDAVVRIACSPDGELVVSTDGVSKMVRVWRRSDTGLAPVETYRSAALIEDFAWSPDGTRLAWSDARGTVELRDPRTGAADSFVAVDGDAAGCIEFLPDGRRLACGKGGVFGDALIWIWDLETRTVERTLRGHTFGVYRVRGFAGGRRLVSAGDATVRIWSLEAPPGADLIPVEPLVDSARFSPDGAFVVTAHEESEDAWVRRVESAEPMARLTGNPGGVSSLAVSHDGRRVACGSGEGLVRVWDVGEPGGPLELRGHTDGVEDVAFSEDDRLVATASRDGTARLFAADDGSHLASVEHPCDLVGSVAVSPDGERVASAGFDVIHIWNARDGDVITTLESRLLTVHSVCFTPDGRQLVAETAGEAGAAWDVATGRELTVGVEHRDALARAMGERREIWRWAERQLELVLTSVATGEPAAWLPIPYAGIRDHPSGRVWAIGRGGWLFVFALEPPA